MMNLFPVQADAPIIASVAALSISLIIALAAIKRVANLHLRFAPEGVAHALLADRKVPYRTFLSLKYHLSGFADDELRKILVRAGGIRLTAGGQEVWGLLSRNRKYLATEDIKDAPTIDVPLDCIGPGQAQEIKDQDDQDLAHRSLEPFERVRAEMMKLGALQCVKPAARQE